LPIGLLLPIRNTVINMIEEKDEGSDRIFVVQRKLLSTPFRPSSQVMAETFSFLCGCLKLRSYPKMKEFQEDFAAVRESVELLLLTRSAKSVALNTEDMSLKVILGEDPLEAEVKLSQPIIALEPLPPSAKLVLLIETKGENPKLTGKLAKCSQQLKVLTVDLNGSCTSVAASLEKMFYDTLPKLGLRINVHSEDLGSLSCILEKYQQHVKAITLTNEEDVEIRLPTSTIQDPEKIKGYAHLLEEVPVETGQWSLGFLSDSEIDHDSWVRTVGNPCRQVTLGSLDVKGQLIPYTLRRRR